MNAANFRYDHDSGPIYGYITGKGLRNLVLPHPKRRLRPYLLHSAANSVLGWRMHELLDQYFAGLPARLEELPLDLDESTDFQREVWQALRQIPRGKTASYGEIAEEIGRGKNAARAVSAAAAANPVHLFIPCHRVIASNGQLAGFAAGLGWKRYLLDKESIVRC
jgi:methylated-DNA-[protein]-cysteine S-methyltransferase